MANYKMSRGQPLLILTKKQLLNLASCAISTITSKMKSEEARAYVFSLQVSPQSLVRSPCRNDITSVGQLETRLGGQRTVVQLNMCTIAVCVTVGRWHLFQQLMQVQNA